MLFPAADQIAFRHWTHRSLFFTAHDYVHVDGDIHIDRIEYHVPVPTTYFTFIEQQAQYDTTF